MGISIQIKNAKFMVPFGALTWHFFIGNNEVLDHAGYLGDREKDFYFENCWLIMTHYPGKETATV